MKNLLTLLAAVGCATVGFAADTEIPTVDFSKPAGVIRKLNGVCNATPLSGARTKSLNDQVLKLEIPYYRFHDASLENPGIELVDINRIFPIFDADVEDPRNYDFRATDDYLKQVVDTGAEIEFRLGESIEHSKNQYFVHPPKDYAKWAEICAHIIRHYNRGWANGYKWNIRRWSIWEEPNTNPQLLTVMKDAVKDIYLPLYKAAVTRIKKEFPEVQVGGPNCWGYQSAELLIDYCVKEKLPLDFLGFTAYARHPEDFAKWVRTFRKRLDDNGFKKTEIALVEWHLGPLGWGGHGSVTTPRYAKAWHDGLTGMMSTAFTAATLIHMQDEPIDLMYYYAMKCGPWGLFDGYGCTYGSYWSMYAFAQLAHGDVRVSAPLMPRPNLWMLASKETKTGVGRVLIATLRTDMQIVLKLQGGVKPVSVKVIDAAHDFEETQDWSWDEKTETLSIRRDVGDSTVWLIETK